MAARNALLTRWLIVIAY